MFKFKVLLDWSEAVLKFLLWLVEFLFTRFVKKRGA